MTTPPTASLDTVPADSSEVRAAWRALLDDVDAIADDITLALIDRDEYADGGAVVRADLRRSTREHVRRGLEVFAGVDDPSYSVPDLWRETGRQRARQGVPMELVLSAYTLGSRVLWRALVTRGATAGIAPAALLEAGQEVWTALDVQNAVMVESYRRESLRLQRRDLQLQQGVLDALLQGRGGESDVAREAHEVLGPATASEVACVVALPGPDADADDLLAACEDGLERYEVAACWYPRGDRWFGLLAGSLGSDVRIADALAPCAPTRMGVAMATDGLPGFATAYQMASRAAETVPVGTAGVAAVTARLPEVLLAGGGAVSSLLVRETVGPLLAQRPVLRSSLLTTLAALLRHGGSPTRAAEELYCHRNTVIYRMKQIEQLTGRDLSCPRDTLLLGLAMLTDPR